MKLQKGYLIVINLPPCTGKISFQYNPESITRTLTAKITDERAGALGKSFKEQAQETISMKIKLEAVDDYATGKSTLGLTPQISALETLVNPTLAASAITIAAYSAGSMFINSPPCPTVMLMLGSRFFPVLVTKVSTTETAHAPDLTPLEAEVDLDMDIVTLSDSVLGGSAFITYSTYEAYREAQAAIYFFS